MKYLIITLSLLPNLVFADYCIYDGNQRKNCYSSKYVCEDVLKNVRAGMSRNDECRQEENKQTYPKTVNPKIAKKNSCLWMKNNKKWTNLGCMESVAGCKYAEKQYKSRATVECR